MINLETDIKRFYFKCPTCENKGEGVEAKYKGGFNDNGGLVLECNICGSDFFIPMVNPSDSFESKIVSQNFNVKRIINFSFEDEKQFFKDNYQNKTARNITQIIGQEELPILKGAWKTNPEFVIDSNDEIYTCSICGANIESESYTDIRKNIELINSEYEGCFHSYVKSKCNPQIISFNSSAMCSGCKIEYTYTAFAKFNGKKNPYLSSDFFLADKNDFNPNINGIYTRKQSKRFLEKLVLRWSLIASKIIIVSPFIGFDKGLAIKSPYKFLNLLEWFLTLNSFDKTQVLIRKTEYGKIKEVIGKDIFSTLNDYGLLNKIIEEMESTTPRFHAKFYSGIIPSGKESYVEILTGSYNLHDESETMENLIFIKMSLEEFDKQYLTPLRISFNEDTYKSDFEILRISNNKSYCMFPNELNDIIE